MGSVMKQRTFAAQEVANILRVSVSTIYGLVKRKELDSLKIGDRVLFSLATLAKKWPEVFGDDRKAA